MLSIFLKSVVKTGGVLGDAGALVNPELRGILHGGAIELSTIYNMLKLKYIIYIDRPTASK
jgi:hypothetical protein